MKDALLLFLMAVTLLLFQMALSPMLRVENLAYPAPYVLFWMIVPFSWSPLLSGVVAITFGMLLDIVMPPHGLQTFCGLWVIGLRKGIFRLSHPNLPPEWELTVSLRDLSSGAFFLYAFPLTLIHHLLYFPLASWQLSGSILLQIGLSAAYSFLWEWIIFELTIRRHYVRA